jgi:hypothetical protein
MPEAILTLLTRRRTGSATAGTRSFVFDANGSTTNDGANTYAYETRGRMVHATSALGSTAY